MIRLITATPGSGKTCLVVEWLLREIDRGFYKEFYTNIEGLRVCGVRPLPADCDWRKLNPEKSPDEPPKLVIIDECQYIDAFMKENRSVHNKIGKDLSTHRHYGIDIWFITQSVKLLNDYVLENVGEHVHLYRARKGKNVSVYWWSYVQKSLTKSAFKDADDMQIWRLNPNMFKFYKSTSQVTDNKARVSKKLVSSLVGFVLMAVMIVYFISQGLDFYTGAKFEDVSGSNKAISAIDSESDFKDDLDLPLSKEDQLILSKDLEVKPRKNNESEDGVKLNDDSESQDKSDLEIESLVKDAELKARIAELEQKDKEIGYLKSVIDEKDKVYSTPKPVLESDPVLISTEYPKLDSNYAISNIPKLVLLNESTGECISRDEFNNNMNLSTHECREFLNSPPGN